MALGAGRSQDGGTRQSISPLAVTGGPRSASFAGTVRDVFGEQKWYLAFGRADEHYISMLLCCLALLGDPQTDRAGGGEGAQQQSRA